MSTYSPTYSSSHQSSHTFMHLHICQSSTYWCICPSIHLSILPSIYEPTNQLIHLLIYTQILHPTFLTPSLHLFIHQPIDVITHVSTHLSYYPSTTHTFFCLFIHTFIHPYTPPHPTPFMQPTLSFFSPVCTILDIESSVLLEDISQGLEDQFEIRNCPSKIMSLTE